MFKPILHNLTKEDGDLFHKCQAYNKLILNKPKTGSTFLDKIENQRFWALECNHLLTQIRKG